MNYFERPLRVLTVVAIACASFSASYAQGGAEGVAEPAAGGLSAEAQHEALLAVARDEEADFDAALAESEGVLPEPWLLEARLLRQLVSGNLDGLMALLPAIDDAGEEFRFGIGRAFISEMQLEGFADTLRCVQAYQAGDMERFVELAVASYRKAPDFNKGFGIPDLLTHYRYQQVQDEALSSLTLPMNTPLANVEGESKTLLEWMEDRELALLDFWAAWCGPCIRLMPSLKEKQATLSRQGVFVAGVNTDQSDQLNNAKKVRQQRDMGSVPWLLDPDGSQLSSHLMIDSIPRMILVDREGRIHYNGHPSDPALGEALAKFDVELE